MSSGNTIVDSNKPLPLRLSVNEATIDPISDNVSVPIIRLTSKIIDTSSLAVKSKFVEKATITKGIIVNIQCAMTLANRLISSISEFITITSSVFRLRNPL